MSEQTAGTVIPPTNSKEKIEFEVEVSPKGVKFMRLNLKKFILVEQTPFEIVYRIVEEKNG